ncbi:MAG: tetraacyldisaccharide 4'-kinase [Marinobacter sp.]|nr:tetraacyldisaccharide 4'-kinase [Marinobacter sp.]
MSRVVERLWYSGSRPLWPLWPLAWLYGFIVCRRRNAALAKPVARLPMPVIVVGNLTAGGTGKSPLTGWLVAQLQEAGYRPAILSRGYGGKSPHYPLRVSSGTTPAQAGDEPVMLAAQTGVPVIVDPQRVRAARYALEQGLADVLVCDDGLQHYALPRDIEIAVFDGQRGCGNGALIPVGPLREPLARLGSVDFVVFNGSTVDGLEHPNTALMTLAPTRLRHLQSGELQPLAWLQGRQMRAVAGIGNPGRFFQTLVDLGAQVDPSPRPDHHTFTPQDLMAPDGAPVVMTAKDAVKCQSIAHQGCWVLDVEAVLPDSFRQHLLARLATLRVPDQSSEQT